MKLEIGIFICVSIIFAFLFFYQDKKKNIYSWLGLFFYIFQLLGFLGKYQTNDFLEFTPNSSLVPFISQLIGYYLISILACISLCLSIKKYNKKNDDSNYTNSETNRDDKKDSLQVEEKKITKEKPQKEKKENRINKKIIAIIVLSISIGLLLFIGIYFLLDYVNSLKSDVSYYKDLYTEYSRKYNTAINKNADEILEKFKKDEKINFYDKYVVFVIDGYGNYYYTYEQMKQVTQGKQYSFWIYSKNNAIAEGYRAFSD